MFEQRLSGGTPSGKSSPSHAGHDWPRWDQENEAPASEKDVAHWRHVNRLPEAPAPSIDKREAV